MGAIITFDFGFGDWWIWTLFNYLIKI